jgi:polysaccharide biosynthesis protein PslH
VKILVIASRIPLPLDDGGAICSYNIIKYLHLAGHRITVCTLNTRKHYQPPHVMADICDEILTVDIDTAVHPLKAAQNLLSWKPYIAERFYSPEFAALILQTLKTKQFDIVHIDQTMIAWYAETIRRAFPAGEHPPIILRAHNIEYVIQERLAKNEPNLLKRLYRLDLARRMKAYERRFFPLFDGIMAITPEEERIMRGLDYAGLVSVVPAGVDLSMFSPDPDVTPRPNTLSYIGGMDWQPNLEATRWFVEIVMPLLREKFPHVEFHVAGKRMPDWIRAYNTHPNVFTYSDVPSAAAFMQSFAISVVPLLSGGGMRLKIVEAMGLGLPIISTHVGAEGIAARHGESILYADTPAEFVHAIGQVLENPALAQQLGENARTLAVERYSWEGIAEQAGDFYEAVIAKTNSSNSSRKKSLL